MSVNELCMTRCPPKALAAAGVDEVVLAVNYQPKLMADYLKKFEEELGVKISYSREEEPLVRSQCNFVQAAILGL